MYLWESAFVTVIVVDLATADVYLDMEDYDYWFTKWYNNRNLMMRSNQAPCTLFL